MNAPIYLECLTLRSWCNECDPILAQGKGTTIAIPSVLKLRKQGVKPTQSRLKVTKLPLLSKSLNEYGFAWISVSACHAN